MDAQSIEFLKLIYPDIRTRFFRFTEDVYKVTGLRVRITCGHRSLKQQYDIYSKGRVLENGIWRIVNPGLVVTKAKPGLSMHHYGLAFDICIVGNDPYLEDFGKKKGQKEYDNIWRAIGKCGQGNGLVWGYDWNGNGVVDGNDFDRPHFQKVYGLQFHEIVELYDMTGIGSIWRRCDAIRGVKEMSEWNMEMLPQKEEVV